VSVISKILNRFHDINRFERIWKIAQVDFKRRYYNDRLGLIWALLNPVLTVLVYYYVFTHIVKRISEGIDQNYAIFLFSGLIFWMAFVEMMKKGMRTLITKRYLIENIKVKKEDLFISSSLAITFALVFNIVAYLVMAAFFGVHYSFNLLFLPILILNVFLIGSGVGMILSIILIYFRDISHIINLVVMLGFWTSGIFFKAELILERAPIIYYLNPFVGIIDNVRRITLYNIEPNLVTINANIITGLLIFILGFNVIKNFSQSAMEKL